jgi:predicted alpha/beta superfamily hydrolase
MKPTIRTMIPLVVVLVLAACTDAAQQSAAAPTQEAAAPAESTAATPVNQPVIISGSQRHVMFSEKIGQEFAIDVAGPYVPSSEPMAVVYVTDGGIMFPLVANSARLLQLGFELPPVLVVGIGYAGEPPDRVMALRTRDLTPSIDEGFVERSAEGPMPFPSDLSPGGGEAFLDFIEEEVKPFIRANYSVTDDETLVGDSLGGLFALHTLFTRPDAYDRYLVGSPSIWWDGAALFDAEANLAAGNEDLNADVFLSVGGLEEPEDADEDTDGRMVSNTVEMGKRLRSRGYPNLKLTEHIFEGETHLSVIPATMSRGLRALFAAEAEALRAQMEAAADD